MAGSSEVFFIYNNDYHDMRQNGTILYVKRME